MAKFEIPASPQYSYLDLNDLKGLDTMSTSPNYMRATDMVNLVKKDGVHRIRSSVRQTFRVLDEAVSDDSVRPTFDHFDIKFLGKVEYVENGKTTPYYVKIGEKLAPIGAKNKSEIVFEVMDNPYVSVYRSQWGDYKHYYFTNYGETGNRNGLYESIEFDGTTWVFTPIGIVTFKINKKYDWEVINVLDDPYIPLIGIGTNPDGTGFTKYESLNLLSDARRVRFRGDGTSTTFVLPEKSILAEGVSVHKLNGEELVAIDVEYTVDTEAGTVTFSSALPKADGADNIEIRYRKDDTNYDVFDGYIANCNDEKLETICRWKILGDAPEDTNAYQVQFDFTIKDGENLLEGTELIDYVTVSIYKGSTLIVDNVLVYQDEYMMSIEKDIFDNTELAWEINYRYALVTHENVKDFIYGRGGSSQVQTSIGVEAKAIDDTGKDLSWMGVMSVSDVQTRINSLSDTGASMSFAIAFGLIVSDKSDLICSGAKAKLKLADTWIDFMTFDIDGSDTIYPYNYSMPTYGKVEIPYKEEWGGAKIPFKWRIELNAYSEKEGRTIEYVESEPLEVEVPKVTFPATDEEREAHTSHIVINTNDVYEQYDVANVIESLKAKHACYYFTKSCTVYGYESNRRIFVTDGSGTDTFSGECLDGKSTMYYFPDDNYRVLGEETEILGYAEADGKLLTFKRGDDSVYVRYGTTLDGQVQFPAMAVTKNLQIFTKPIQVGNEVLVITRDGIKSIIYVDGECRVHLRSYFINSYFPLWRDYNYDEMQWYVEENMLHIFLDKYEFVADLNVKSYVAEGNTPGRNAGTSTLQFQYDWYVCEHNDRFEIPKVVVYQPRDLEQIYNSSEYNDLVPVGYSNKSVYRFDWNGSKVDGYMDGDSNMDYYPIAAKYVTPFLDFGAINLAKTIKYVYVNTRATNGSAYEIGYIDENGYTETMEKIYSEINDQKTRYKNTEVPFPKLIQIKSKIKKFMNIKLYIKNLVDDDTQPINVLETPKYGDMNFDRILIQYQASGKYRGE